MERMKTPQSVAPHYNLKLIHPKLKIQLNDSVTPNRNAPCRLVPFAV